MMPMRCLFPARLRQRFEGFTLIEIAVVLVILAMLLAMLAGIGTAMVGQQRREATRQRLTGVETALALFVSQNKRLPCPADGRIAGTNASAGFEERNASTGVCQIGAVANQQRYGVAPWRTLGLAEPDTTDGWGNRLTYRVAPELALYPNTTYTTSGAMDFTYCDPAGSGALSGSLPYVCLTTCTTTTFPTGCTPPKTYTATKGLKVRNLSSATLIMDPSQDPSTGAAYIVISHGENGVGAYSNQGTIQSGSVASGTLEAANNAADVAFTAATSAATPTFVDDFPSYNVDTGHFDDFVLRPSILSVATKAQLGPRAH
jgi:prepilin-type N-terminal cleavage/methylation domain-containing protein